MRQLGSILVDCLTSRGATSVSVEEGGGEEEKKLLPNLVIFLQVLLRFILLLNPDTKRALVEKTKVAIRSLEDMASRGQIRNP